MNLLLDIAPKSVFIGEEECDINSDFRTSILFELLMQDGELSDEEKIITALELYYQSRPSNIEKAIDNILWFYRCGKDVLSSNSKNRGRSISQVYSFEFDDDYIYSAFLDQYGIDLQDIDYLHWWKFKAMFKSLKEDNEIVKIMGYRSMDITKIKDKEQRSYYKMMKDANTIPNDINKNEQEKINEIEEALMNNSDISNLL